MAHQDPLRVPDTKHSALTPKLKEKPVKKYLVPLGVGVAVFGSVTAFAATLNVSSSTLGSGNGTVASCNASASVSYTAGFDATTHAYQIATTKVTTPAPVAPAAAVCAGKTYKITFLDGSNVAVGTEVTGTVGADGTDTVNVAAQGLAASSVAALAVVITG